MAEDPLGTIWRRSAALFTPLARAIAAATGWLVFNPGRYGERWHARFRRLYPLGSAPLLICGLNPGPYGMAQSGVPFTDLKRLAACLPRLAADLRAAGESLELPGLAPPALRPFLTRTFESSSVRVYRFLAQAFGDAESAFTRVAVVNPCPLLFIERESAANRTPADLPRRLRARGMAAAAADRFMARFDAARAASVDDAITRLEPAGVVLLGRDVDSAIGAPIRARLGESRVLAFEHPARAVPDRWARGLADTLRSRGLPPSAATERAAAGARE